LQAFSPLRCPRGPSTTSLSRWCSLRSAGTTKTPALRGFLSPLPDSNRGPPPYHGDSGFRHTASDERLLARSSCNSASSSVRRTPSSTRLELPRETLNLSPNPVPKQAIFDRSAVPAESAARVRLMWVEFHLFPGLGRAHRPPGVPGDLEDEECDGEADDRVGPGVTERDQGGADHDAEGDEPGGGSRLSALCRDSRTVAPALLRKCPKSRARAWAYANAICCSSLTPSFAGNVKTGAGDGLRKPERHRGRPVAS
jgi:hypothetical protein